MNRRDSHGGRQSRIDSGSLWRSHFGGLRDSRCEPKLHPLINIIFIALCGAVCGADGWTEIEAYGKEKRDWLSEHLDLSNGIPSHDTFGRVFGLLDPVGFQECFLQLVQSVTPLGKGQVIAIDGKTLRRSHDKRLGKKAIHMVSAWATSSSLVLGQEKVESKSNEITAIPRLLEVLDLSGHIVTIDAMGCQRKIAKAIIDGDGDYVLALKENQGRLHTDVSRLFRYAQGHNFRDVAHDHHRTVNKGHGRIEIRDCWTIDDPDYLRYLRDRKQWKELRAIVMVVAERRIGNRYAIETRYYITSLPCDARLLLKSVRSHWQIENRLHWVLDIAFREDHCRARQGHSAQNLAILRHIALNLLRQDKATKLGVKGRRLRAGWNDNYLLDILCL